jgi:hypothetical protein
MLWLLKLLSIAESVFKAAYIQNSYNNEIQEECSSGLPRQVVNQSNKVLSHFLTFLQFLFDMGAEWWNYSSGGLFT